MAPKKDFKHSPVMNFISEPIEEEPVTEVSQEEPVTPTSLPIGYRVAPESKSRRLQLLIKPSIHNRLKDISNQKGTSINNLINEILEDYVNNN